MPYEVFVCFVHEVDTDDFSKAIEAYEGTDFSHVLCFFVDERGRRMVYHSASDGEVIEPFEQAMRGSEVKYCYRVPMAWNRDATLAYMRERIIQKVEYSMRQIVFNQAPRILLRMLPIRVQKIISALARPRRRPLVRNGDEATICCEAQLMLLRGTNEWHRFQKFNQDKIGLYQFHVAVNDTFTRVTSEEQKYETKSNVA